MKKFLKTVWLEIRLKAFWVIFLSLSIAFAAFLLLSLYVNPPSNWSDLFVNLSVGFVSALITVFFIDFLRESNKEIKWHDSKATAMNDLLELTNMLISYMTIPFGYKVTDYQFDSTNLKESSKIVLSQILQDILQKDLDKLVEGLNFEKWDRLELNLLFIKPTLSEYLQVYNEILPPDLLALLLKTRRAFNKFYSSFGLVNIGWIKEKKSPPGTLLVSLAEDLKQYYIEISNLSKVVYNGFTPRR